MSEYDFWLAEVMRTDEGIDVLEDLVAVQKELNQQLRNYVGELKNDGQRDDTSNDR